ncbi:hypothetical protein ABH930_002840 [Kitasatospora sp. GAS204A]|uniref:hypothetical protein n=1 Tax=unclassified Kitasatospora TaxID=2633591 RepID=UPI0024737AF3|nr:hypothetical protein [Kitasatospora sp. GAS204B]MDH6118861.1 hypothetical protein [Kitasatospora sp. GAS204B]
MLLPAAAAVAGARRAACTSGTTGVAARPPAGALSALRCTALALATPAAPPGPSAAAPAPARPERSPVTNGVAGGTGAACAGVPAPSALRCTTAARPAPSAPISGATASGAAARSAPDAAAALRCTTAAVGALDAGTVDAGALEAGVLAATALAAARVLESAPCVALRWTGEPGPVGGLGTAAVCGNADSGLPRPTRRCGNFGDSGAAGGLG